MHIFIILLCLMLGGCGDEYSNNPYYDRGWEEARKASGILDKEKAFSAGWNSFRKTFDSRLEEIK